MNLSNDREGYPHISTNFRNAELEIILTSNSILKEYTGVWCLTVTLKINVRVRLFFLKRYSVDFFEAIKIFSMKF